MDDAKTREADLIPNGEGSGNRVRSGDLEPQTVIRSETLDGSSGHDHGQEDGSMVPDHFQEDGPVNNDLDQECCLKDHGNVQEDGQSVGESSYNVDKVGSEKQLDNSNSRRGDVDTTTPFESVKEAVSMFSGIVDWKAHKIQMAERRKRVVQELRKSQEEIPMLKKESESAEESKQQVLKELDNAKRRIEELKLNLEREQTEESQEKQDTELTKLRVEELEQGIADESSVAAKAQLEVAQARHQAIVSELEMVNLELENLQKDYTLLVSDRDLAIKKAQEAVSSSTETEKDVEDLNIKLITIKQALESAHGAYLEAEEHRIGATTELEQCESNGEEELQQLEEESEKMSQKLAETEDLKSKLDSASILLQDLNAEMASYMEEHHKDVQSSVDLAKIDLEEVKKKIEKATEEVNDMKHYAHSLNMKLEQEKQNQGTEAVLMASIETDIISEVIRTKAKEVLVEQLEKAAKDADRHKSRARKALKKAKTAANHAKKRENEIVSKLNSTLREVEAARASERLALGAISAVEESESSARRNEFEPESEITLSVEKYHELCRKAKEAEDEANERVSEAISQIDLAKESELKAQKNLEQVKADLASKKEELSTTMRKAEKAKEGKVVVEQELRIWRSENEQRRKAENERKKKKKRSMIPRIFMFLCRKRGRHSNKNNT